MGVACRAETLTRDLNPQSVDLHITPKFQFNKTPLLHKKQSATSDPTCKDSALSTAASIIGIMTFVSAISIGCFAYYRICMSRTKQTFDLLNTFWSTEAQFNTFSDHITQLTGQKVEGA